MCEMSPTHLVVSAESWPLDVASETRIAGNIALILVISFDNFGSLCCHITLRTKCAVKMLEIICTLQSSETLDVE